MAEKKRIGRPVGRRYNKVRFVKTRDVKAPSRDESRNDAGTDLYIPYYSEEYLEALREANKGRNGIVYETVIEPVSPDDENDDRLRTNCDIILSPGEEILIPSGIKVDIIDKDTYLEIANKSGVATKMRVVYGAHVIDASYQGEIFINLHNIGKRAARLRCGEKVVQVIHKEYIRTDWEEITSDEYCGIGKSERGEGCLSSTGMK